MFAYVLGLLFIAGAIWIFAIAIGWGVPYFSLIHGLDWLRANPWESAVAAVFLLLLGLLLFVQPRENSERSFRTTSKNGEIRISKGALQEIIARCAMSLAGVLHVESSLKEREKGLQIMVACQFEHGVLIPKISEELQGKVKKEVELYTGISVTEVKVLVRRLEQTRSVRVR